MLICTLGEPFSINVAMIAALLEAELEWTRKNSFVLIGSLQQWRWQMQALGRDLSADPFHLLTQLIRPKQPGLYFVDTGGTFEDPRQLSGKIRGKIAADALAALADFDPKGKMAVLTCPIDKYNCRSSGFNFPGQTEFFEHIWQSEAVMILAGPRLKVALATNHLPLKKVAQSLSPELIAGKIKKFAESLQLYYKIARPRIGICGLNPHCGEQGLCGDEETRLIEPGIKLAKMAKPDMETFGPWPADTIFWRALQGSLDGVLAMYHDQGLGPLKTIHFDDAVNISGGLPYLRVSPDHGPAQDLFLSSAASPRSFRESWQRCIHFLSPTTDESNANDRK